jgi:predicted DNA-binding transcriptional regulator YafY
MNRIDRLFGILILLQSRKFVAGEKIAAKFRISMRTLYRDIRALTDLGIPVSFEPHKGYFIVQGYFLPPVSFNSQEAHALLLMETLVYGFSDKSTQEHYSNALNKVKNVLRAPQRESLEALNKKIKIQIPQDLRHNFDYLSTIQQAIVAKTILTIDYKNGKEEISQRNGEPIGLIFYALNWHLIVWCHMRKDYRDFKVARILKLRDTGLPFTKSDHIDMGIYMKQLPVSY